ncbi:MAG: peptidoglycan/LPS O-acetylase OafA/YrhL [Yoonia sp.]|jgi:peptidoglycan/LPS O-acetylase OafA/YrhL
MEFAVQGFFVLSGYLMALVVCQVYGYSPRGFIAFASNRLLRLLPSYWVVLCLSVFVILIVGNQTSYTFRRAMYLPQTLPEWMQNATMIFPSWFPSDVKPRLPPATWALTVELFYYALIGLGLFHYKALTWTIFSAALAYHLTTIVLGYGFAFRYSFILDLEGPTKGWDGFMLLTLTIVFLAVLSLFLRRFVDRHVEQLRKNFRPSRKRTAAPSS